MANPDRRSCCGRGVNGLNIVLLLFAYKLRYPDQCAPLSVSLCALPHAKSVWLMVDGPSAVTAHRSHADSQPAGCAAACT